VFFDFGAMMLLLRVVQVLDLLKACMHRRAVDVVEKAHVVVLEVDNAKLLTELKQARLASAEVMLPEAHCL
jgi:hypothetical protein